MLSLYACVQATASLKAKRREEKQMANLGCSSPNSTGSGRRQAMHLSRISSYVHTPSLASRVL